MFAALKRRDFRLLFAGQAISYIGDQFDLIALPWLVLMLTHDPLQLGLVLAVAGVPRALLMLVGGAWADRHSPRTIMLVSDALRCALTAGLALAILTGNVRLWMVYLLAVSFGTVSGFFLPAAETTVPRLLDPGELESGNALMMGVNQLASFLAPAAAGILVAAFGAGVVAAGGGGAHAASLTGIGVAFAVDGASFLASALALALMHRLPGLNTHPDTHPLTEVTAGLRYAWGSARIRWMVLLISLANLLFAGPLMVGVPVLAQSRLSGGAAAFGLVLSGYGLGSLGGMIAAGALPRPSDRVFASIVVGLFAGFAAVLATLGFVSATWLAVVLMVCCGTGNGYIAVLVITSLQRMTATEFLGRVMSLVMLAMVGLMPISQAIAGAVVRLSPTILFVTAGAGFAALATVAFAKRTAWTVDAAAITAPVERARGAAHLDAAAPTAGELA
jgi:MFS family permease